MPAGFDRCVENGGRVRTIAGPNEQYNVPKGHYRRVCILRGDFYLGHVEKKKEKSSKS